MNLSPRWVSALGDQGIDAAHWSAIGRPDAPDEELFRWAAADERVVLTCDLDFTHLLALRGADGPSVVLLRARDTSVDSLGRRVTSVLKSYAGELARGALITVDETKSRLQVLPLRLRKARRNGD